MIAKAAVIGTPLGHTLSPEVFQQFAAKMGRDIEYKPLELASERLAVAFALARSDGTVGWNITLPHKIAALSLVDEIDSSAQEIGAANVIRFGQTTTAFNTDALGFLAPMEREGFSPFGHRAVVFGAGGAARAVAAALHSVRAAEVLIVNRTLSKAQTLAADFSARAMAPDDAGLADAVAQADLLVNATSLGLGGEGNPLPKGMAPRRGAWAYDLVYRPIETPFLLAAKAAGAETFCGLPMLVAQAAATWRIWFNETIPNEALVEIEATLARRIT